MAVFLLTVVVLGLFFVLMSVRLIFIRQGEFRGTCATQSPFLAKEGIVCGYCGKTVGEGESCKSDEKQESVLEALPGVGKR